MLFISFDPVSSIRLHDRRLSQGIKRVKPHRQPLHYRNFSLPVSTRLEAATYNPSPCMISTNRSLENHTCLQWTEALALLGFISPFGPHSCWCTCSRAAPRDSCILVHHQVTLRCFSPRGWHQARQRAYWSDKLRKTQHGHDCDLGPHAGTGTFCEIWRSRKLVNG